MVTVQITVTGTDMVLVTVSVTAMDTVPVTETVTVPGMEIEMDIVKFGFYHHY